MRHSLLEKIINLYTKPYCAICKAELVGTEEAICLRCSLSMPFTETWQQPDDNEMAKLFWHQIPIKGCTALFHYHSHSPSAQLLYRLKYGNEPNIGRQLGKMIALKGMHSNFFDGIDAIIPIPLSPNRIKTRGYNQSLMIAEGIASVTHLPIITNAVIRNTFKESQTHKSRWQRKENVEHAFLLNDAYPLTSLAGKHLLIIDDVCTTGSTIIACCQQLKALEGTTFSVACIGWAQG